MQARLVLLRARGERALERGPDPHAQEGLEHVPDVLHDRVQRVEERHAPLRGRRAVLSVVEHVHDRGAHALRQGLAAGPEPQATALRDLVDQVAVREAAEADDQLL